MQDEVRPRYVVLPSVRALESVIEQADYYAAIGDMALSARWEQAAFTAMESLRHFPNRGSNARFGDRRLQLKWVAVPKFPFMMYYTVSEALREVYVLHVAHVARDSQAVLPSLEIDK